LNTVPVVRFTVAGHDRDAPVTPVGTGRPFTVVYDGACKVCQRLVKMLVKWDTQHRLEIVPSQAPGVHARFPWIPDRAYAESVQLVGPGGRTWQGAAALERIIDELPKGKLITWIFSIPFVRPIAERLYRWFARNRYHLGCGEHCQFRPLSLNFDDMPDGEKAETAGGTKAKS
jgi:predicted DCC family thiol-disulfide oxidoreductase YuxK